MHIVTPFQVHFELSRQIGRDETVPANWRTFVDADTIRRVRDRLGLNRSEKGATQPTPKRRKRG